jgi:hypothetical protein
VRACLHRLGYVQTPELSAPGELATQAPLLPGAWVEVKGPQGGVGRRGRRPPRR